MEAKIEFDKEQYYPGETVVAKFMLYGPFHSKSRNIELRLESGEKVGVEYSTGSGNSRQTHTAWGDEIYAGTSELLSIPQESSGYLEYSLRYILPEMYTDQIDEYKFDIFHRATVKLDIALAKDENYSFPIPLITGKPDNIQPKSRQVRENDVEFNISKDVGCEGDRIDGSIMMANPKNMRGFRIEFEQMIFKKVRSHSDRIKKKVVVLELPRDEFNTFQFVVPRLPFQFIEGAYFTHQTSLKLVIDIPFGRDVNIPIDFLYFHTMLPEGHMISEVNQSQSKNCINCGSALDLEASFCAECGTQN